MDAVHETVIKRLRAVYGEPKTPDLKLFIAEYVRVLSGFDAETLRQALDTVIDSHVYPTWPTPGEIREAAATPVTYSTPDQPVFTGPLPPEPTEESKARVREIVAEMKRAFAEKSLPDPATRSIDTSRDAMRDMQRTGDPRLHQTDRGLSELSKRITGERD